jgi:hypothetical protein
LKQGGFCITFSFLYIHLRLINPEMPRKKVVKLIMKGSLRDIDQRIRKFIIKIDSVAPNRGSQLVEFDNPQCETPQNISNEKKLYNI